MSGAQEAQARAVKVDRMIEALVEIHGTTPPPEAVALMSQAAWVNLERAAGVNPTSEKTRAALVHRVRTRFELKQSLSTVDPFSGFPRGA